MRHRLPELLSLLLVLSSAVPRSLAAQSDLGKLQGRITGADGQPIAQAQVLITGTAFGALTDPQGFYFINNIPAGTVDARFRMIGLACWYSFSVLTKRSASPSARRTRDCA